LRGRGHDGPSACCCPRDLGFTPATHQLALLHVSRTKGPGIVGARCRGLDLRRRRNNFLARQDMHADMGGRGFFFQRVGMGAPKVVGGGGRARTPRVSRAFAAGLGMTVQVTSSGQARPEGVVFVFEGRSTASTTSRWGGWRGRVNLPARLWLVISQTTPTLGTGEDLRTAIYTPFRFHRPEGQRAAAVKAEAGALLRGRSSAPRLVVLRATCRVVGPRDS